MLKSLVDSIQDELSWRLDQNRFMLLGNAFSKFSVMLFRDGQQVPTCVAKAPCNDMALTKCETEYSALEFLNAEPITGIRAATPLGKLLVDSQQFFLQEFVDSPLLLKELPLFRKCFDHRHFSMVTDHLVNIYEATRSPQNEPNQSYARCFQHGDFWLGNIGMDPDSIILYDLEFADQRGLPLYDLMHFGIYYYRVLSNIGAYRLTGDDKSDPNRKKDAREIDLQPEDIYSIFGSTNQFSRIMYDSIGSYSSKCDIDDEDTLALILDFVENDRAVNGLKFDWKNDVKATYLDWRR